MVQQVRSAKYRKLMKRNPIIGFDRLLRPCFRCGVTLLEMVVVVGIIGILMAIIIPAVQSTREATRRTQCQNNQRQVGLAIQSFESANRSLPSFYNGTSLTYPLREWDLFHMHSWRVMLLPHLEQSALRDKVEWKTFATEPINKFVAQSVVSMYICPSGSDPLTHMGRGLSHSSFPTSVPATGTWYFATRSDYDAMAGIQVLPDPVPTGANVHSTKYMRWGIWGWPNFGNGQIAGTQLLSYRPGKFSDVTDGLSNTIAIVERGGKPIDLLKGKPHVTVYNPKAEYPGQTGWSASNTYAWAINLNKVGINQSNSTGIYSLHPGGANVAMADGSVRFVSESTDFDELIKLFSRSGGPDE
jgi:prepilin-type processing-associated H-X9-DG protein/prepilin-type N-terminal cleavage/methylation domain-containing protein